MCVCPNILSNSLIENNYHTLHVCKWKYYPGNPYFVKEKLVTQN